MVSRPPKFVWLFGKFTAEQDLKSFLGRKDSIKPPFFVFYDSLPFGLQESRELRALIRWVWGAIGIQTRKKKLLTEIFGIFEHLLTQNPTNQDSQLS